MKEEQNQIIMFKNNSGEIEVDVKLHEETVWLTLNQLAKLFHKDKSVISRHLKNIYEQEELERSETVANFATVQTEGKKLVNRQIEYYNLDAIISVGYSKLS